MVCTDFVNTVEDMAESFAIGKAARTKAIEPGIHMIKRKRLDENVLVTTIFNTVSKYHRIQNSVF